MGPIIPRAKWGLEGKIYRQDSSAGQRRGDRVQACDRFPIKKRTTPKFTTLFGCPTAKNGRARQKPRVRGNPPPGKKNRKKRRADISSVNPARPARKRKEAQKLGHPSAGKAADAQQGGWGEPFFKKRQGERAA